MKAPLSYYGGKQNMLKHILPLIPDHRIYTEPFAGGAAVLFAKTPAACEIINDLNRDLINFYKVAKNNYSALKKEIDTTLHSRDLHTHAAHILNFPDLFNEEKRAWATWALSKMSFASNFAGSFGYDLAGTTPLKILNAKNEFTQYLCARLENVTIENRDGLKVIEQYDHTEAFHFVDPPYVGSACGHYENMFSDNDLENLLQLLRGIAGKFMLTMFPNTRIKDYADNNNWIIHKIERTISASRSNRRRQEEWITCNYTVQTKLELFE